MSTRIADARMTCTTTRHVAELVNAGRGLWEVSWLPGVLLDRNQAITALTLAETAAANVLLCDHPMWPHVDSWARELGLTGPDAVVRASYPPEQPLVRLADGTEQ